MCKSQITLRKFLKLFLQIFFYNIVITAIFMIAGYEPISVKSIVKNAWPIMDIGKSFTSSYLLFYMFIPYLNILIANIERRSHGQLIMLCLLIYSLLGQVPFIDVRMSYVSWFCVLYFIASYIRLYGLYRDGDVAFWRNVTLISLGGGNCFYCCMAVIKD